MEKRHLPPAGSTLKRAAALAACTIFLPSLFRDVGLLCAQTNSFISQPTERLLPSLLQDVEKNQFSRQALRRLDLQNAQLYEQGGPYRFGRVLRGQRIAALRLYATGFRGTSLAEPEFGNFHQETTSAKSEVSGGVQGRKSFLERDSQAPELAASSKLISRNTARNFVKLVAGPAVWSDSGLSGQAVDRHSRWAPIERSGNRMRISGAPFGVDVHGATVKRNLEIDVSNSRTNRMMAYYYWYKDEEYGLDGAIEVGVLDIQQVPDVFRDIPVLRGWAEAELGRAAESTRIHLDRRETMLLRLVAGEDFHMNRRPFQEWWTSGGARLFPSVP